MEIKEIIERIKANKEQKKRKYKVELTPEQLQERLNIWQTIGETMIQNYKLPQYAERLLCWEHFVDKYGDDMQKGILLRGNTGAGKTFLFDVANNYNKIDSYAPFVKVNARDISAEFSLKGWETVKKYTEIYNLLIDDLGAETITQHYGCRVSPITEIIDRREELGKITHATTNVLKLETIYDDRTISRMYSLFNVWTINTTKDYRRE